MSSNSAAGLGILETGGGTEDIQAKDNKFVHPWENLQDLGKNKRHVLTRGEGIYVYDSEGKRYIDGPAGMWCVNIGYGRSEIADAVAKQLTEMPYDSPLSFANIPAAQLAERLTAQTPGDLNNVFFTTAGSLSVDSALRFVMFYNTILGRPEKRHIISRQDAYHGSTYLSASCSGKERDKTYQVFETDFIHHLPSPNPYRRPEGMSVEAFCDAKVADLENKILELGPENVAVFIAEPILASGGVIVPPPGYQKKTLEVCRRHDVLYISDEVVTAFGALWAHFRERGRIRHRPGHHHDRKRHLVGLHTTGRRLHLGSVDRRGALHRFTAIRLRQRLHLLGPSGVLCGWSRDPRHHRARGNPRTRSRYHTLLPGAMAGASRHPARRRRTRSRLDGLCRVHHRLGQ